jgi:hypothetical protein
MSIQPKIYCDTNTLAPNIRDEPSELEALKRLRELCQSGKCSMYRSHIVLAELERTPDVEQRERLRADYELVEGILHDEKLLGVRAAFDHLGTYANCPIFSDVQDPKLFEEIYQELKRRIPNADDLQVRRDAENLSLAISNNCDVFLTRDSKTIIKPLGQWLEQRYPPLKVRLPSQILAEIEHS